MAAHRCSDCGISYPGEWVFKTCPIHNTKTDYFGGLEPDDDWEDQVAALKEHLLREPAESLADDLPLIATTVVIAPGGAYFVSSWDVYDTVRGRLRSHDLFRVGKQVFEILEYLEARRQYWVRPFSLTLSDEELAALAGS